MPSAGLDLVVTPLIADQELLGGGMHLMNVGGRLDVHVDFNRMEERALHRRLNILVFLNERWDVNLPQQAIATDYLVTFYNPPGRDAQLHLFAIDDLLALDAPHIPAWLPEELNLQSTDRG